MNSLPRIDHLIDLAIEEDAGLGDVTSRAIFSATDRSRGIMDAKQDLVVCGLAIAARVFARVDAELKVTPLARDGDRVKKGARVLGVTGPTASMLTAERTALNFVQRLSGVATLARRYADAVANTGVLAVDVKNLLDAFYTDRPGAVNAVLIMSPGNAAALIGANGTGSPFGVPIVKSEAAGGIVVALDPAGVVVADGGVEIDTSNQAAIAMVDNPSTPTAAMMTDVITSETRRPVVRLSERHASSRMRLLPATMPPPS